MKKQLILTVLIVLATLTLAACAPRTTTTILSPEEGTAYAAEVDEIVENMIVGFNNNDWTMHSRDCTEAYREAGKKTFQQSYDDFIGEVGTYQSKTLDHVEVNGKFRILFYHLVFENDPNGTLTVWIIEPDRLINGMYFEK